MKIKNMPSGPLMTNTYLVWDEESKKGFIVDPGGYNPALSQQAKMKGIEIEYIILTHGHSDHIGGVNLHRKDFEGVKVVAAENELSMLRDAAMNLSQFTHGTLLAVEPDILVDERNELQVGNMTLKFIMTPGHSPGGMCICVENHVFCGDTIFRESIGRTDFPGCSFEELINSIKTKIFTLPDDTILHPGHMGDTTVGHEKEYNPFV